MLVRKLTREQPMIVRIPLFHGAEEDLEHLKGEKIDYAPWIVRPSGEVRLDEHDPYGVSCANLRPFIARDFATICKLTSIDPFHRTWHDQRNKQVMRAQTWGRNGKDSEEVPHS